MPSKKKHSKKEASRRVKVFERFLKYKMIICLNKAKMLKQVREHREDLKSTNSTVKGLLWDWHHKALPSQRIPTWEEAQEASANLHPVLPQGQIDCCTSTRWKLFIAMHDSQQMNLASQSCKKYLFELTRRYNPSILSQVQCMTLEFLYGFSRNFVQTRIAALSSTLKRDPWQPSTAISNDQSLSTSSVL